MGNVHMEAAQINYRGGEKKMSVEEALKNTSGELAEVKRGLTNVTTAQLTKTDPSNIIKEVYMSTVKMKVGLKFYTISVELNNISAIGSWTELFTIPDGYRPVASESRNFITSKDKYVQIQFNANGTINIYSEDSHVNEELVIISAVLI